MPYGLRGFRQFCRILGLKIWPFQAFMLKFYFVGVTELVILISKKNGKTTLLAALSLYHLLMVKNAECVIGASSRDQATILFNQAHRLITEAELERRALPGDRHEPTKYEGVFEVRTGYRVIRFETGRIRVLAADADTADGIIPTLAIVDELHRHPSGALYGVFRDGLLGDAQMVTISTAGAEMDSPLGVLLTKAKKFESDRQGYRTTYTSPDRSFMLVEWALSTEDDVHDMKVVKRVNPAPWHTPATLRRRHDSPSTTPGQWLRFACGIWVFGEEPWLAPGDWDPLAVDLGGVKAGEQVWCAIREGAIAIVARRDGGVAVRAMIGENDQHATEQTIIELDKIYDLREVAYDGKAFGYPAMNLEKRGIRMVEVPHRAERLAQASVTLQQFVRDGLLHHDGDSELRAHVMAGTTKQSETGWRLVMAPENRGLIALAFAVQRASLAPPAPTVHTWAGVG